MARRAYSGRTMSGPADTRVMTLSDEAIAEGARLVLDGQPVAVPPPPQTRFKTLFGELVAGGAAGSGPLPVAPEVDGSCPITGPLMHNRTASEQNRIVFPSESTTRPMRFGALSLIVQR